MIDLLLTGENYLVLGLLDQAERTFRQVLDADPHNGIAAVGLARVALERGDEAGALALAHRALELDSENAMARRMVDRLEEVAAYRAAATAAPAGTSPAPPAIAMSDRGGTAEANPGGTAASGSGGTADIERPIASGAMIREFGVVPAPATADDRSLAAPTDAGEAADTPGPAALLRVIGPTAASVPGTIGGEAGEAAPESPSTSTGSPESPPIHESLPRTQQPAPASPAPPPRRGILQRLLRRS